MTTFAEIAQQAAQQHRQTTALTEAKKTYEDRVKRIQEYAQQTRMSGASVGDLLRGVFPGITPEMWEKGAVQHEYHVCPALVVENVVFIRFAKDARDSALHYLHLTKAASPVLKAIVVRDAAHYLGQLKGWPAATPDELNNLGFGCFRERDFEAAGWDIEEMVIQHMFYDVPQLAALIREHVKPVGTVASMDFALHFRLEGVAQGVGAGRVAWDIVGYGEDGSLRLQPYLIDSHGDTIDALDARLIAERIGVVGNPAWHLAAEIGDRTDGLTGLELSDGRRADQHPRPEILDGLSGAWTPDEAAKAREWATGVTVGGDQ